MTPSDLDIRQDRLWAEVDAEVRETRRWTGREELSDRVWGALRRVPRHRFVPEGEQRAAYGNYPLPIGHGQTISQPYIVAIMSELLDLAPSDRVLEIGTGCGYQTAVLAQLAAEVYSIELVPELHARAKHILAELGCGNVHLRQGDGRLGWPEAAPFDALMVTAAAESVPEHLVAQLAPGGRMVIPLGGMGETQTLLRGAKDSQGRMAFERLLPVAFVPLRRGTRPDRS